MIQFQKLIFIDKYWVTDFSSMPHYLLLATTAAGLAQLVECLIEEKEVVGLIFPRARPILWVLKWEKLRNEGTDFALQMAGSSHGSDDHIKWRSHLQKGGVKIVSPTSTFVLIHWLSNKVQFFFPNLFFICHFQISIDSASVSQKQKNPEYYFV